MRRTVFWRHGLDPLRSPRDGRAARCRGVELREAADARRAAAAGRLDRGAAAGVDGDGFRLGPSACAEPPSVDAYGGDGDLPRRSGEARLTASATALCRR